MSKQEWAISSFGRARERVCHKMKPGRKDALGVADIRQKDEQKKLNCSEETMPGGKRKRDGVELDTDGNRKNDVNLYRSCEYSPLAPNKCRRFQ